MGRSKMFTHEDVKLTKKMRKQVEKGEITEDVYMAHLEASLAKGEETYKRYLKK